MPQSLLPLLKTLTFTEPDRAHVTLSDPDLIRLDPEAHCVKLRRGSAGFPSNPAVYAISPLAAPVALREFVGFQAIVKHVGPTAAPLTSVGFRLTDGVEQYWYNGTGWVVDTVNWNTAGDVSANIAAWTEGIAARQFGAVVHLDTFDPEVTPEVHAVKFGIRVKTHSALEDILYRGLAPALRSGVRAVTDLAYRMPAHATTVNMTNVLQSINVPFKVVDVDSVFSREADPDLSDDLLANYDPGTRVATLTQEVAATTQLQIQVVYEPTVAIEATNPDFIELASTPGLVVTSPDLQNATPLATSDTLLLDENTGAMLEYQPALRGRLVFAMDINASSGIDAKRLAEAVLEWAASTPIIRAPGVDGRYRLRTMEEFRSMGRPSGNGAQSARATFVIEDVLVFRRAVLERGAVLQFTRTTAAE